MIHVIGKTGSEVMISYNTTKAEVHAAVNNEEMMKFIVDNRPIVVYQFWIDTGKDGAPDMYKMLYSKAIPAPENFIPSDI
jgi:hypothetical protein